MHDDQGSLRGFTWCPDGLNLSKKMLLQFDHAIVLLTISTTAPVTFAGHDRLLVETMVMPLSPIVEDGD